MGPTLILTLTCPDTVGIVAKVSTFIADRDGWIIEAAQHGDPVTKWFFMRVEIAAESLAIDKQTFTEEFRSLAEEFEMDWKLHDPSEKKQVVILVSRSDHCLSDLLHRWRNQDFQFDIPCVISNHMELKKFVEWHGIPFHYVPITADNKKEAYQEIDKIYQQYKGEVMVLARYMQIIPPDLCEKYEGKIINIHHSFLPSFSGAKPYHQAFNLGVKLIGATCHYVTEKLDTGPIIEQDVIRISHRHMIDEMTHLGKDVEKNVLSRGLKLHVEDRVLIHGNKTIVFN